MAQLLNRLSINSYNCLQVSEQAVQWAVSETEINASSLHCHMLASLLPDAQVASWMSKQTALSQAGKNI